jgi:hypothetical protein
MREIADFNYDNRFGRLALEAIADLEASCSPPENASEPNWQPIETAPKGDSILLCVQGFEPCVGRWWPLSGGWCSFDWEGHFESDAEAQEYINGCSYEPTHWAPRPKGPLLPRESQQGASE